MLGFGKNYPKLLPNAAVAGSVPPLPAPASEDRSEYFRNHPCVWTWEQLYARLAPHMPQIIAAEMREANPVRRRRVRGASRSRVRARIAGRSHAD
jgi:hypothetical protein